MHCVSSTRSDWLITASHSNLGDTLRDHSIGQCAYETRGKQGWGEVGEAVRSLEGWDSGVCVCVWGGGVVAVEGVNRAELRA